MSSLTVILRPRFTSETPLMLSGRLRGRVARDRRCGLLIRKLAATTVTVVAAPSCVVSIWVVTDSFSVGIFG